MDCFFFLGGMHVGLPFHYAGQLGTSFYLQESLCRREEILSPPRFHLSESVVFHLFTGCLPFCRVWFMFMFGLFYFCIWKTSDFLRFTCSLTI